MSGPCDNEFYSEFNCAGTGKAWGRDKVGNHCDLIDETLRAIYLRDNQDNLCWNIGQYPLRTTVNEYQCVYTPASTALSSTVRAIQASQRAFVPRGAQFEVWTLTVKNTSRELRRLSLFAFANFGLKILSAPGWFKGAIKRITEYDAAIGGILSINDNPYCPNERIKGFLISSRPATAWETHPDRFFGRGGSFHTPVILDGWNGTCSSSNAQPCGLLQHDVNLEPGETVRIDYALGLCGSREEVASVLERISDPRQVDRELSGVERAEETLSSGFRIRTGEERCDAIMNHWIKKQMLAYLVLKSGFRDNLQVDHALCMADFQAARENFLRALSAQHYEGHGPHSFRPLKTTFYADKPAWIMMTAAGLVMESGDFSLLEEIVPFRESSESGTVWEHLIRAMRWLCTDLGPNGFNRLHHADWNDGLETKTEGSAERESIMVTQQLCYGLLRMEELARLKGDTETGREARKQYEIFKARLNEKAWDGRWYIRMIGLDNERIGSACQEEGKIFLNTQSWAVLSQTAPPDRARTALEAVDELIETEIGFKTCSPGFSKWDPSVGRISGTTPDFGENGGFFHHAAGFKLIADCMLGRGEEAWRTVQKILPNSRWNPVTRSGVEPFVLSKSTSLSKMSLGRSVHGWRTGTSAWMAKGVLEWILGVRRDYSGLLVDPCLPAEIKEASVQRLFRGATYTIFIDNSSGRGRGVKAVEVDGKPLEGRHLPVFGDGRNHKVEVVTG